MGGFNEVWDDDRSNDFDDYQSRAMRSFKPKAGMSEIDAKAMLGAIGLAGEVGECTDPIKKWFFHGNGTKAEVRAKLREEIGDVLWYAACLADAFGLSLGDIADNNITKLLIRYPETSK